MFAKSINFSQLIGIFPKNGLFQDAARGALATYKDFSGGFWSVADGTAERACYFGRWGPSFHDFKQIDGLSVPIFVLLGSSRVSARKVEIVPEAIKTQF